MLIFKPQNPLSSQSTFGAKSAPSITVNVTPAAGVDPRTGKNKCWSGYDEIRAVQPCVLAQLSLDRVLH